MVFTVCYLGGFYVKRFVKVIEKVFFQKYEKIYLYNRVFNFLKLGILRQLVLERVWKD